MSSDPLSPEARWLLEKIEALREPPWEEVGIEQARVAHDRYPEVAETAHVASVQDIEIPTAPPLRLRVYRAEMGEPAPVVLFIHGGGWVVGNIDSYDGVARRLTAEAGCVTVSVDYRLAPEHPYPAALEDCYAALAWLFEHATTLGGDPTRIVIAGDSAGGNLAAATALIARQRRGPALALQVLIYPITDFRLDTESMARNGQGFLLTRETMAWFYDLYCPPDQRSEPTAAPLHSSSLSGLPPAYVVLAGCDPLYDEGLAYAQRLASAGVHTTIEIFPSQFHGFFKMTRFLADARTANSRVAHAIRAIDAVRA